MLFGSGVPSQITLVYYLLACFGFQLLLPLIWDLVLRILKIKYLRRIIIWEKNWGLTYFFCNNQAYSIVLNVSDAILSIVSCVIFVYLAVQVGRIEPKVGMDGFDERAYHSIFTVSWLIWIEFSISVIFTCHFFIRFAMEERKLKTIIDFEWFIDIATAFVGLAAPFIHFYYYNVLFFRAAKLWYVTRFFRPWLAKKLTKLNIELLLLVILVMVLIFTSGGLIWVLENSAITENSKIETFLFAIYFVVVTLATVGYGDITVQTNIGKIAVIIIIGVGVAVIPTQASHLIYLIQQRRKRGPARYKGNLSHVVVLAWDNFNPIDVFLNEFYHEDRGVIRMDACMLLSKNKLPGPTKDRLEKPFYQRRVTVMQGRANLREDLAKTRMDQAECCFLLTHSEVATIASKVDADAQTILACYAIKKFFPKIPIYVQIENEQHKAAVKAAGVKMVICTEQLKIGILAQSCLCPGFAAIIGNLVNSYAPPSSSTTAGGDRAKYMNSLGFEVYVMHEVDNLIGQPFHRVVAAIYKRFGALLIGLGTNNIAKVSQDDRRRHDQEGFLISLNPPMNTKIKHGDFCVILGQDEEEICKIKQMTMNDDRGDQTISLDPSEGIEMLSIYTGPPLDTNETSSYERGYGWTQDHQYDSDIEASNSDGLDSAGDDGSDVEEEQHQVIQKEKERIHRFLQEDDQVPERSLNEATINSVEEAGIKHHILLLGGMIGITRLVGRLRRYKLKKIHPIIILADDPPTDLLWNTINRLPQVYFIKGNDTDKKDLLGRANALEAKNVIILHPHKNDKDQMTDAKSIMVFRMVKRGLCFPVVDLEFSSNAQFLGVKKENEEQEENHVNNVDFFNPFYSAGQVYVSSLVETLLVQSFFNPYMVRIVEELMKGLVFSLYVKTHFKEFIGKEYGELFQHILSQGFIPLALRKKPNSSKLRQVHTNPSANTLLEEKDIIILIQNSVPQKKEANQEEKVPAQH